MSEVTPAVAEAVAAVREHFAGRPVQVTPDGGGGAVVIIDNIDFGDYYHPRTTWLGFLIDAACPQSDIYPYYSGRMSRVDEQPHGEGVSETEWQGRSALQLSRRSNLRNGFDNAVLKTERVIQWFTMK